MTDRQFLRGNEAGLPSGMIMARDLLFSDLQFDLPVAN
jgi:hypothetical protein